MARQPVATRPKWVRFPPSSLKNIMNDFPIVRRATAADLNLLAPLLNAYRCFYQQQDEEDACRQYLAERLAAEDSVIFLATLAGEPAGFTQLYPTFSTLSLQRVWILNDLFVSAQARRCGAGSSLLQAAEDFARSTGAVRMTLVTGHDNLPAQTLYESRGWQPDTQYRTYNFTL